jgi:hypothetical protein
MDYIALFNGKTKKQFWEISENWYARLNRLKQAYIDRRYFEPRKSLQLTWLIEEMIQRMEVVGQMAIQINMPEPPKNFIPSGFTVLN